MIATRPIVSPVVRALERAVHGLALEDGAGGGESPEVPDRTLTFDSQPLTFGAAYLTYTPS